jgi:pyruvate,water dikinase
MLQLAGGEDAIRGSLQHELGPLAFEVGKVLVFALKGDGEAKDGGVEREAALEVRADELRDEARLCHVRQDSGCCGSMLAKTRSCCYLSLHAASNAAGRVEGPSTRAAGGGFMTMDHREFPTPEQIDGAWDWDKIHAPRPLTPLAFDAIVMSMSEGFTKAQHDFGSPLALKCRLVNYYFYATFAPEEEFKHEGEKDIERYVAELDRLAAGIGERWVNEWEPSLPPVLEKARTADYRSMTNAQMLEALDEQLQNLVYFWNIHGWINLSLVPATALVEFYNAEVQPEDKNEAWNLMQGVETKSVETSKGLWGLSREVRKHPLLRSIFEGGSPHDIMAALERISEGRKFLTRFSAFLDDYGWRSDGIYEIADATWREEPSIPLNTLQGYLGLDEDSDPGRTLEAASKRRDVLVEKARSALAGDAAKLERFEALMEAAKYNLRVTEDHSFWIDQMGTAVFRHFCLEAGHKLAQDGVIEKPEDVFLLHMEELRSALRDGGDRRATVNQRRDEMARWATVVPPFHLGHRTEEVNDPFFVAMVDKMLGLLPVEPSSDPDVISGVAASPGSVQGIAKVVRSLQEASKLQPGDIMVCEMTVPTWVPLFSTVKAVVADSGGILSHCAIVAREFNLPAVVGTRVGTEQIKDGMTVTVDGSKGLVRIDSR